MKIYTNGAQSMICDFGRSWTKSCLLINAFDLVSTTVKAPTGNSAIPVGRSLAVAVIEALGESAIATKAGQDENRQCAWLR
jgi:hypothetical protein